MTTTGTGLARLLGVALLAGGLSACLGQGTDPNLNPAVNPGPAMDAADGVDLGDDDPIFDQGQDQVFGPSVSF